jgi:hypothetical protein
LEVDGELSTFGYIQLRRRDFSLSEKYFTFNEK